MITRYEGSSTWVHVDGKSLWENITDAPLPRREKTIRDDYNVLKRNNRIEITDFGWEHKQDNFKIIRSYEDDDIIQLDNLASTHIKKLMIKDVNMLKFGGIKIVRNGN